jgi:hypothetical protein
MEDAEAVGMSETLKTQYATVKNFTTKCNNKQMNISSVIHVYESYLYIYSYIFDIFLFVSPRNAIW